MFRIRYKLGYDEVERNSYFFILNLQSYYIPTHIPYRKDMNLLIRYELKLD